MALILAAGLEGYALHTAVTEATRTRGNRSWLRFVRRTRSPELPVILLEDCGALLGLLFALTGVSLSVITGNRIFDGIATLGIGTLLVTIAALLAVETKSLIIGESALPEELTKIESALLSAPGVDRIIHMRTMHLGPEELLVAEKIGVGAAADDAAITATIDDAEAWVRAALPTAEGHLPGARTSNAPLPERAPHRARTRSHADQVKAGNDSQIRSIT